MAGWGGRHMSAQNDSELLIFLPIILFMWNVEHVHMYIYVHGEWHTLHPPLLMRVHDHQYCCTCVQSTHFCSCQCLNTHYEHYTRKDLPYSSVWFGRSPDLLPKIVALFCLVAGVLLLCGSYAQIPRRSAFPWRYLHSRHPISKVCSLIYCRPNITL